MEYVVVALLVVIVAIVLAWLNDLNTIVVLMAEQKRRKAFIQEILDENKELKQQVGTGFFNKGFPKSTASPLEKNERTDKP